MEEFKILNKFGITPSKNFEAAGYDFYVPKFENLEEEDVLMIIDAFSKSYNMTSDQVKRVFDEISLYLSSQDLSNDFADIMNVLQLYLGLTASDYYYCSKSDSDFDTLDYFLTNILIFDKNGIPGIVVYNGDFLLFNSGIKVKLDPGKVGIFFNKSGKGNKGYDVKACVVDEDYNGFVHMSLSFHKNEDKLFCGDKLVQFLIFDLPKTEIRELTEDEFNEMHADSKRGADGFGSSDIKH